MTSPTTALAELQATVNRAQKDFDENVYDDDAYEYIADLKRLLAAARSLAEGETIWWCVNHRESGNPEVCQFALRMAPEYRAGQACCMVEKILADPT